MNQSLPKIKWAPEDWKQWEACPRIGNVVDHSLFIGLKVPLSDAYEKNFSQGAKSNFTVQSMQDVLVKKSLAAGMVIDATLEERYFHDTNEWEDWDIDYVKLRPSQTDTGSAIIPQVPPPECVEQFFKAVERFWTSREDHVCVFSIDGNMTGFLIVSFLVRVHPRISLPAAVAAYANSNHPGIFSRACIEALYRYYHVPGPGGARAEQQVLAKAIAAVPRPPDWVCSSTRTRANEALTMTLPQLRYQKEQQAMHKQQRQHHKLLQKQKQQQQQQQHQQQGNRYDGGDQRLLEQSRQLMQTASQQQRPPVQRQVPPVPSFAASSTATEGAETAKNPRKRPRLRKNSVLQKQQPKQQPKTEQSATQANTPSKWSKQMSKSHNKEYYFNAKTGQRLWVEPSLPQGWGMDRGKGGSKTYVNIYDGRKSTNLTEVQTWAAAEK